MSPADAAVAADVEDDGTVDQIFEKQNSAVVAVVVPIAAVNDEPASSCDTCLKRYHWVPDKCQPFACTP